MQIIESRRFRTAVKRLRANQKRDLDDAIKAIAERPAIGIGKAGDLSGVRVYKFRMINQVTLLAYSHDEDRSVLSLIDLGSHENFYRNLKS